MSPVSTGLLQGSAPVRSLGWLSGVGARGGDVDRIYLSSTAPHPEPQVLSIVNKTHLINLPCKFSV